MDTPHFFTEKLKLVKNKIKAQRLVEPFIFNLYFAFLRLIFYHKLVPRGTKFRSLLKEKTLAFCNKKRAEQSQRVNFLSYVTTYD